jgi:hypothetical protein
LPVDKADKPPVGAGEQFTLEVVNDVVDEAAGTRSFTLKVYHPSIIWTGELACG